MSEDTGFDARIEPLLVLSAQTRLVRALSGTPQGERRVVDALGGSFEGPRLRGRIHATGGDWVSSTAQGSMMDVRLLLETEDGVGILLRYTGKASQRDGRLRIEVAGIFDAPAGAYDWLNEVQAFGTGAVIEGGVRYHFYRFK